MKWIVTPSSLAEMIGYFEQRGFEAEKTYISSIKQYTFTITKDNYNHVGFFTYPDEDGRAKCILMKQFCDTLISDFLKGLEMVRPGLTVTYNTFAIEKVIFNDPATIVFWSDKTKTVVKTQNGEKFDPEKGLAMAIAKRSFGNQSNYFNHIKKWADKYHEEHPAVDEEVLYFDDKPVIMVGTEDKTNPIKCDEVCNTCKWGVDNDCDLYPRCGDCPHTTDNSFKSCKCSFINKGEPCPYFEKAENK